MARNEEKAQAMLNRWVSMKRMLHLPSDKRPALADDVNSINECEKWRAQIIQDIAKKVQEIQNAGLGEHKIRDLNDEINKLIKEKEHWEERIKKLGGADYKKYGPRVLDKQGVELPGTGGYKYFGAAKDLPGVRELFVNEIPNAPTKSRVDLYKNITYDYYGAYGEEDYEMLEEESKYEKKLFEETLDKWIDENKSYIQTKLKTGEEITQEKILNLIDDETYEDFRKQHELSKAMFCSLILDEALHKKYISENKEDEAIIALEAKKKALLERYFKQENENDS